ncbi:MAG: ferritin family protein [Geobacteraceae bacterium]|nr:ferritin family protein [Geobacteraceae bacterium]
MEPNSLDEILEFALEREDAAYRLYLNAAKKTSNPSARKIFEELAEQEAGHKRVILKLDKEKIAGYTFVKVPDMGISEYLVDIPYHESMSYQEILVFAMKNEEKAFRFYQEAGKMTDDPDLKQLLSMLANEEQKHKFRLESLYEEKVLTEM